MAKTRTVEMSDGRTIPSLAFGLGTAWFKRREDLNSMERPLEQDSINAVLQALEGGFVHLDGAEMYGTEREQGAAIAQYLAKTGVSRDQLFITTKVYENVADVRQALRDSLTRLGLSYVDLYLIHAPFKPINLVQTWNVMEELVAEGLTRSIGVSNFRVSDLEIVLKAATIKPVINQVESHPYLQQPELYQYCKQNGILMEAYSPLLTLTRKTGGPVDAVVEDIAQKINATPGQVLLAWSIARGYVPITTTSNPLRLKEYLEVSDEDSKIKLTEEQVEAITQAGASVPPYRHYWVKDFGDT